MTAPRPVFNIRAARPDDAPAIRLVHESSIRGLGPAAYTAAEVESWVGVLTVEKYVEAMMLGDEAFIVAEAAPTAGGDGVIAFCSWARDEVKGLYVAPAWARRGVGTALLRLAEAAIVGAGHRTIRIGATLVGRPFYEAHGYAIVRHKKWKTRGGLAIDTLEMEKQVGETTR
jgi:predicted N-acetyltransferase YhbS